MLSFKTFATASKNLHLEHLEDQIIDKGAEGGRQAVAFLKSIRQMLQGSSSRGVNVTVKWDGAPAVICGHNPENGKFFVGTKSVFNKNPKINYTISDIRKNHSGGVVDKLVASLNELKRIFKPGIILQGDLLFTKSDLKSAVIDGQKMISFTPNTITYAVPEDSKLGGVIKRANLGIVFHTSYTGKKMSELSANFGYSPTSRGSSRVFMASARFTDTSGSSNFNTGELSTFDNIIKMAEGSLQKGGPVLNLLSERTGDPLSVAYKLKVFFNYYIRNHQGDSFDKVKTLVDMFKEYFNNSMKGEVEKRKTPKGQEKFKIALEGGNEFIKKNERAIYFAIASHISLQRAKVFLLQKMNQIQSIGSFIRTPNGFRVTAPEGFVALSSKGAVKLVDRLEFSKANFQIAKDWVKG
tara:strand:- start:4067 stop:5296 length:1230 start_codon:yes stop_codon:yes gene_type:complete